MPAVGGASGNDSGAGAAPAGARYWVDTAVADASLPNQQPTRALTAPLAVTSIAGVEGPISSRPTLAVADAAGTFRYGLAAVGGAGAAGAATGIGFMVDGRAGNPYTTTFGTVDVAWTGQPYRTAAGAGLGATLRGGTAVTAGVGGDAALQAGTGVAAAHGNILFLDQAAATLLSCTNAGAFTFTASTFNVAATGNVVINSTLGSLNIGTAADDLGINIGTGTTLGRIILIGNTTGTTSVAVSAGTGASSWTVTGAGTFDFVAGTGAVNFASTATDHTTTLGSQTGVSATTVAGGSGGLRLIAVGPLPSGTVTLQNQTFAPAATHVAVAISPTWAAENFAHTALGITATQNGANSSFACGINLQLTKATVGTVLAQLTGINFALTIHPEIGQVTNLTGIAFPNLGPTGVNTYVGVDFASQSAPPGGGARCIRIQGSGNVTNGIQFNNTAGGRCHLFSSASQTMQLLGDLATGGFQFLMTATGGVQTLSAVGAGSGLVLTAQTAAAGSPITTHVSQAVYTGGLPTALTVTGGAHTGLTAASEDVGANFNFSATKTWAAGAGPLAMQREVLFQAPTYVGNAVTPLVITNAATVAITGAPTQGANMTLSNPLALWVQSGNTSLGGGQFVARTPQGAGNLTLTAAGTQYIIAKTAITGGGDTVTLPDATLVFGRVYVVKDEAGTAAANNITINATAGNIDGAASTTIAANYGSKAFYSNGADYFTFFV